MSEEFLSFEEQRDRIKSWWPLDGIEAGTQMAHIACPSFPDKAAAVKHIWDLIEQYHALCEWQQDAVTGTWFYAYSGYNTGNLPEWKITEEQWRRAFEVALALDYAWEPNETNWTAYAIPGFTPPDWPERNDADIMRSWRDGVWRQQNGACWACLDELMFEKAPKPYPSEMQQ